ncbi:hypothetical protein [Propionicimonas sp.]|uniref:hypothetical protein n=1 Tax=Propionicimonas sp. TaxID=1955623 RepID=UPI0017968D29|nr:hypothetical protein [Propionicimonas sp.]MBU3976356.1 hypothetical protein [Actinomycetota bacterium]MBA3022051.1 hypothetical protein [Propionicimonas sp.]MBU3987513.1 hypothetical protein [Actinomycetota bacterium]MBU4006542.1 hypothetical protein [Actinomycetota bacterium]MBU4065147.1 hypothetical protein [Actinomycetota bacterium]
MNFPYTKAARLGVSVLACLASCFALLATPTPASAAANPHYEKTFSTTQTVWVPDIKTCLVIKSSGTMKFGVAPHGQWARKYIDRVLEAPKIQVWSYNKCGAGRKAKKLYKLRVSQATYSPTCSTSVGIGVGLPWSVGVSGSITCGTVMRAKHTSGYGAATKYTQSNSKTAVSIADELGAPLRESFDKRTGKHSIMDLRIPIDVNLTAYSSKSKSDSVSITMKNAVRP